MASLMRQGQRLFTRLHVTLYRATGGRVGGRIGPLDHVLLTTRGRRSGRLRTTPLAVLEDGGRLVLVASNGGAPRHPDWYLNLTASPEVTVQHGGQRLLMRARTATPSERAELWPRVVAHYAGYQRYQDRAPREIPLVVCERRTAPA
jgi:deazaflavin-dependent oxidoreductase (nitroreductase family)